MKPLPEAIAELMARRDMNATALAAASGVTDATVSYYLSGKRGKIIEDPDVQVTLGLFSEALGVPMKYWFEWRLYQIGETLRRFPDLETRVYREVMTYAADLAEQAEHIDSRSQRGGPKGTRRERGGNAKQNDG